MTNPEGITFKFEGRKKELLNPLLFTGQRVHHLLLIRVRTTPHDNSTLFQRTEHLADNCASCSHRIAPDGLLFFADHGEQAVQ